MDRIHVKSTSRATADCSVLILRETGTTRLIFRPQIVENPNNPKAAVHGMFLFQKKGVKDSWIDAETAPLSTLKAGDGYKLDIKSAELLQLFDGLQALYELHASSGVPRGQGQFIRVNSSLAQLAQLGHRELVQILAAEKAVGPQLLSKLLKWATDSNNPAALVDRLVGLGEEGLRKLNIAIGLRTLRAALELWEKNADNQSEDFWQSSLTQHSFVLEYVFSWPVTVVKEKAYVGGKSVLNSNGRIVDFLVKNRVTRNAALIEIKTPASPLLGKAYRGTYLPSEPLSGAVQQVLDYKHTLLRDYNALRQSDESDHEAFEPKCIALLGNTKELKQGDKLRAFELYRAGLAGVQVITFDELFERTRGMLNLLERPDEASVPEEDDIPF